VCVTFPTILVVCLLWSTKVHSSFGGMVVKRERGGGGRLKYYIIKNEVLNLLRCFKPTVNAPEKGVSHPLLWKIVTV
jgi:hypothetical protein